MKRKLLMIALAVLMSFTVISTVPQSGKAESEHESEAADNETEGAEQAAGGGEVQLLPNSTTKEVLSNDRFKLYIDEKTAAVRVEAKSGGAEWSSVPQLDRKTLPANKAYMESAVLIKYTEGTELTSTYPFKDKELQLNIAASSDMVRSEYELGELQIGFAVEYRLLDDGIEVKIPDDSIWETGVARLVSLEVFPFMNAALGSDDGAIFVPDGSGALMRFKESHPTYYAGYSEMIYGPDTTFAVQNHETLLPNWRQALPPKEHIAMPVFGIYRNGAGVLGIVSGGDYSAKINATPSGIRNIPYYRTAVEFVYRNDEVIFIGNNSRVPLFQGQRIAGDRKVRYVLLEGGEADYVGMAKAYRSYLQRETGLAPIGEETIPLQIRLLGGIHRDEVIGTSFVKLTTFEQAKQVIDDFAASGVPNVELTLVGWNDGGLYGNQPDHFPVSRKLGGEKGLKKLLDYAGDKGVKLILTTDYARVFAESDGYSLRKDTVKGLDREAYPSYDYYVSNRYNARHMLFYLMKPERVYEKRIGKELAKFAKLGVDGVRFAGFGNMLFSDLDHKAPMTRLETAAVWRQALSDYKEKGVGARVDYGFAYTYGLIDHIDNAPLDSSHFIYMDETVPFYQLVLHGLVPYSSGPINLRDDAQADLLRAIEYGAVPSLELTYAPTSKLQRTLEDRLLSSHYTDWIETASEQYGQYRQLAERIQNKQMTNHEKISEGVYRTTYEGGIQVIVNYGSSPASVDGTAVQAVSFAVTGGE